MRHLYHHHIAFVFRSAAAVTGSVEPVHSGLASSSHCSLSELLLLLLLLTSVISSRTEITYEAPLTAAAAAAGHKCHMMSHYNCI